MKSNEEINRDLGISESSFCDEDEDGKEDETCDSRPMYNGIQGAGVINVLLPFFLFVQDFI